MCSTIGIGIDPREMQSAVEDQHEYKQVYFEAQLCVGRKALEQAKTASPAAALQSALSQCRLEMERYDRAEIFREKAAANDFVPFEPKKAIQLNHELLARSTTFFVEQVRRHRCWEVEPT